MKNKKIVLIVLTLIFTLNFNNVSACSLTDLSSCSFSDLKSFVLSLFSKQSSCSNEYFPVCSKSGKTYTNKCLLNESKEEVSHLGNCLDYPYNLTANECIKEKFEWNGYKCVKKENSKIYTNELGFSLLLPESFKINEDYIELPKERNNTNLFYNKLEITTQDYCSDISLYTKVKDTSETTINKNKFEVVRGSYDLELADNSLNVNYINYILKQDASCTSFLFSMYSEKESSFSNYSVEIETFGFDAIMKTFSYLEAVDRKLVCDNFGDLNSDNIINEKDLDFFDFGVVENNIQKKGDLNDDAIVDLADFNILKNFINGNVSNFPVCYSKVEETKKGSLPKISFNNNFTLKQDTKKTEAEIRINFDLTADVEKVLIPIGGVQVKILNEDNINVENITWNTGAQITDDGYLFLESEKTTWFTLDLKLKAKEKPVYSKVLIEKINYIDESGVLKTVFPNIETTRFYLNSNEDGNLICGDYGDINNDGFITEEDLSYIINEKELDEDQKLKADVTFNGEINFIDAIEIKRYLLEGEPFTVCSKTFAPNIYDSAMVSVQNNEDKSKHVVVTIYLDSANGESLIPAKVSFNQDDNYSGIYFNLERDGSVSVKNLKLFSSAEPTELGFLKIKKDVPTWARIEFDVEAINDTALVNFKLNKVAYLSNEGRDYVHPSGIKTGDIFLNYKEKKITSPCDKLGDLNNDTFVSYEDYNYLKRNLNLLLTNSEKFINADLNKDGTINILDLKELDSFLSGQENTFSGCLKEVCSSDLELVYTKDGFIYANECYLKDKKVNCYLNKDCGL